MITHFPFRMLLVLGKIRNASQQRETTQHSNQLRLVIDVRPSNREQLTAVQWTKPDDKYMM